MAAPIPPDVLATGARHLLAGKYFQVAAYTMLIYDHAITFGEEVEKIWKRKITGAAILFLINRYASPLEFIVILDAFNDPNWSKAVCDRFVNFEGSATLGLVSICELIMILRVYALYKRNNYVLAFLLAVWITGIIVASVGMTSGFALDLPPPLVGCIDTGNGSLLPALWVVPLITNSLIFLLTLWQSRHFLRRPGIAPTIRLFVRDGTIYFIVIFMANLFNTLIYFTAVDDLKAIGASFSQLITSTMVSRLVLNLRASSSENESCSTSNHHDYQTKTMTRFMDRTIGNLGERLEGFGGIRSEPAELDDEIEMKDVERYDHSYGLPTSNWNTEDKRDRVYASPMVKITTETRSYVDFS